LRSTQTSLSTPATAIKCDLIPSPVKMCRYSAPLFALSFIATTWFCDAFVSPIAKSNTIAKAVTTSSHATINSLQVGFFHPIGMQSSTRRSACIALKSGQSDDDEEGGSVDETEKDGTSMLAKVTLGIFKLFSYCLQFLGVFFSFGLVANLLGFGYTFDFEHGLVVDRIQNIRNEVQFEREIEREEREDLKGVSGSSSSKYLIAPNIPESNGVSVGDQ